MKAGWAVSTLGETCEMYQPKTITAKEMMLGGPYPVFGANGVIGRYDQFNHEEPQLLITCRGATCGTVNVSEPKSWITGNAMVVRPKDANIDLRFLEYLFRGGVDISPAITGAAQPQITRTNLNPIEIRYPLNSEEQQRIVTLLDEAFDGIATARAHAEKNLQNARAIFESHLDAVLSRSGAGYTATTLGAEVDLLPGYAFPSGGYTDAIDAVRLLRGDNIMQGYFRWEEAKGWPSGDCESYSRFALQEGDVVIAMDRPWVKAGLKRAQICSDDLPSLLVQRTSRLRTLGRMRMDFLSHLTGSQSFSRHLLEVQTGIGVPHISGKQIESFKFMLPPMSDQESIANTLNELLLNTQRLDEIYEEKLTALDELKKSLLHQAFAGLL